MAVFVKLPEVPVTVTVVVPVVAVLVAVSVNVLVFIVLLGLNDAVTPAGRPDADRLTLPAKPFCGVTVMVLVPLPPCVVVRLFGDAESVKFATGTGLTVREIVAVFDRLPDVPVMVTVTVPAAAVLLAASVNVLVLVALLGLNDAVTPLGSPEADRLTLPVKPFCGVTVMVLEPLPPCVIVRLFGEAESVKFAAGTGLTVRETMAVFDKLPDVPVMVTVTVPVAAVLLAVNVNELVLAVLVGFKDAVTPLGSPVADMLTLPVKPFCGVTVMVLEPLVPCVIVTLLGEDEIKKFGGGAIGVLTETLSKVAVARAVVLPLVTAKPTYTFCPMMTVWFVPTCVQLTPSADA